MIFKRVLISNFLFILSSIALLGIAAPSSTAAIGTVAEPPKNIKGWHHIFALLKEKGVDEERLLDIFSDERMPEYAPLQFKVKPNEKHLTKNYKKRNSHQERANAFEFYTTHKKHFLEAERKYGVLASIMLAILQIETKCGQVTGDAIAFHRLSRLATATSRDSIEESYDINLKERPETTMEDVEKRAKKLEDIFLPQVVATIRLADLNGVHPLDIKGSYAGAIGYPQFLPNNVFVYGVDGNNDGAIDLYNPIDAIHSVGNFLKQHGWKKKNYTKEEKEKLILYYNRSTPYAQTVVAMASTLSSMMAGKPNPKDAPPKAKKKGQNAKKAGGTAKTVATKQGQKKK